MSGIVQQWVYQSQVHNVDELKQRLLHVRHDVDQTNIDIAMDTWCGPLHTCVLAKDGHFEPLLWQYSAIWWDVSVFVKCDTMFFYKLLQIWTSNFPKVVWQHTEGTVGSIIWVLLEIYFPFQQWKNYENPLRIDKVIAMSLVYHFLGHSVDINYY